MINCLRDFKITLYKLHGNKRLVLYHSGVPWHRTCFTLADGLKPLLNLKTYL